MFIKHARKRKKIGKYIAIMSSKLISIETQKLITEFNLLINDHRSAYPKFTYIYIYTPVRICKIIEERKTNTHVLSVLIQINGMNGITITNYAHKQI